MSEFIVVIGAIEGDRARELEQVASPHRLLVVDDPSGLEPHLPRVTAVVGAPGQGQVSRAPRLRWVHSWAAGPDSDLTPEVRTADLTLTSAAGNGGVPLAEHAMLLMMMLDREALAWVDAQRERRWDRHVHPELIGRTIAIIGLGHCGADLARKAQAFGMRVLGMNRSGRPVADVDELFDRSRLHEMLGQADFLVVTAPLNRESKGMLGRAEFAMMKPDAFFICVSRGGIADDEALLDALRSEQIAGAGLDAHGSEPLPPDSPFWELPRVIITPHNGATTPGTTRRGHEILVDNLARFVRGAPLRNVVDKEL